MELATSEMKAQNEIPVLEPARIVANETELQRIAQVDLISYSDVIICFVSLLNVTNVSAASHQVLSENGKVWCNGS